MECFNDRSVNGILNRDIVFQKEMYKYGHFFDLSHKLWTRCSFIEFTSKLSQYRHENVPEGQKGVKVYRFYRNSSGALNQGRAQIF